MPEPRLHAIEGTRPGPDAEVRAVGGLVLRLLERTLPVDEAGATLPDFTSRRVEAAVETMPPGPDRRLLRRILTEIGEDLREPLVAWAAHLEATGRLGEASRALSVARTRHPDDAAVALHAARVARKADDPIRAGELYRTVIALDRSDGRLARLASIGRALVSDDPARGLTVALREARRACDDESAAVAQEARAGARRRCGDVGGAVRDYLIAAARYRDPVDVGRVGHDLADLLTSVGDLASARVVLVEVEHRSHPRQALWARARLFSIARSAGDQVGARRWADAPVPPLTSIAPHRVAVAAASPGRAHNLRWVSRVGLAPRDPVASG